MAHVKFNGCFSLGSENATIYREAGIVHIRDSWRSSFGVINLFISVVIRHKMWQYAKEGVWGMNVSNIVAPSEPTDGHNKHSGIITIPTIQLQ